MPRLIGIAGDIRPVLWETDDKAEAVRVFRHPLSGRRVFKIVGIAVVDLRCGEVDGQPRLMLALARGGRSSYWPLPRPF